MIDESSPTIDRFNHLFKLISSQRFLTMQGLGNEVPFFICAYDPMETVSMCKMISQLERKLASNGVRVLNIDLYDLSIDLLKNNGLWERVLEFEQNSSKTELKELLHGVLDPETQLVPAIAAEMAAADFDVLFLTGAGEVFPFIRTHTVLNNLQSTAKKHPTVLFFPGKYTLSSEHGSSLDLFDRLHDDRYYRAFNIFHVEI